MQILWLRRVRDCTVPTATAHLTTRTAVSTLLHSEAAACATALPSTIHAATLTI